MAQKTINVGSAANSGGGDPLRNAMIKINENFTELYLKDTSDFDGAFSSLTGTPTTLAGYGITDGGGSVTPSSTDTFTNKSGNISQWTNDSNYLTTVPAQTFASLTSKPTTLAGYGITDAATSAQGALAASALQSVPAQTFASLTGKPTTLAGYGITDALALGTSSTTALAGDTTFSFADLTSKPTTIAGYGITDALALGTSSTTALAGDTALFSGDYDDLSNKPTIPTAYTDSDVDTHLNTGSASTNEVLSWNGSDFAWVADGVNPSDISAHLNTSSASADQILSWTGSDFAWVAQGGSGLQSRVLRTSQTSSLADGAEADLDITGFKAYALLFITTDRAARVRLYVTAATRTADAARAEGVDPTSDAGLIAEVITTGAETVIISPGAYGFNLESSTTTNIPCRVTNKSGSTSTVQVTLGVLQLEA